MTRLILIRHGQTDWNAEGRWQGQSDPSLNERGREEARRTGRELRQFEFAALYSSDLRRALETAQIIALRIGVPVMPEPRLREINLGVWQGMLATDIQREYPRKRVMSKSWAKSYFWNILKALCHAERSEASSK